MSGYGNDNGGFFNNNGGYFHNGIYFHDNDGYNFDDVGSSSMMPTASSTFEQIAYRATNPNYAVQSHEGFSQYAVNAFQLYQQRLHEREVQLQQLHEHQVVTQVQLQRNQMMQNEQAIRDLVALNGGYFPLQGSRDDLQSQFLLPAGQLHPSNIQSTSQAPPKAATASPLKAATAAPPKAATAATRKVAPVAAPRKAAPVAAPRKAAPAAAPPKAATVAPPKVDTVAPRKADTAASPKADTAAPPKADTEALPKADTAAALPKAAKAVTATSPVPKPAQSKKDYKSETDLILPFSKTENASAVKKVAHNLKQVALKIAARREVKHAKPTNKIPTPPSTPFKPMNDVELVQVDESYMIPFSPLHGQVWRAVRLVGEEIRTGVWPLAKRELKISLPVVLEQFIREIFLPYLQGKEAVEDRPYVATMLALREVMTQNGKELFRMDLDDPSNMEEDYCAQLLATSIILAANGRQTEENQDLLAFVEAYDGGAPEFKDALTPMAASIAAGGGGTQLSRDEALVWKVAYNMARDKHPLMRVKGVTKGRNKTTPSLPKPTACFVAMVEELLPCTIDKICAHE